MRMLLVCIAVLLFSFWYWPMYANVDEPPAVHPIYGERGKAEYERLLKKHGLWKQFSIIKVTDKGEEYFLRDGQWCKFQ